jgi:hypothetical protein
MRGSASKCRASALSDTRTHARERIDFEVDPPRETATARH